MSIITVMPIGLQVAAFLLLAGGLLILLSLTIMLIGRRIWSHTGLQVLGACASGGAMLLCAGLLTAYYTP